MEIAYMCYCTMYVHLPEIEFESCDPGILIGGVEFCNRPDKSSKFAA